MFFAATMFPGELESAIIAEMNKTKPKPHSWELTKKGPALRHKPDQWDREGEFRMTRSTYQELDGLQFIFFRLPDHLKTDMTDAYAENLLSGRLLEMLGNHFAGLYDFIVFTPEE